MSDISSAAGVAGTKTLWVAIGMLGAAVVGLGGALYLQQGKQAPAAVAPAAESAPAVATTVAPPAVASTPSGVAEKKPVAAAAPHVAAPKPAAPRTAQTQATSAEAKSAPAVKPVCADCATVTAVTPVEREGQASGAGAVAGGVLGALVGQQIGQGQGKDVATVVGAIGGGIAGNQMEKKMKKVTVYVVELRMDDGSRRTLEQAEPMAVGARVRVNGEVLSPLGNAH